MIRNISVLFVASALLFFPNVKAFDKEALNKTAEFLKEKERSRKLRALLYPGVYPEKKAINAEQYLQKKHEKLLKKYEELRGAAESSGIKKSVCGLASLVGMFVSTKCDSGFGLVVFFLGGLGCSYFAGEDLMYLVNHPSATTEKEKREALLKILDEKINAVKEQIWRDKELVNRKNLV